MRSGMTHDLPQLMQQLGVSRTTALIYTTLLVSGPLPMAALVRAVRQPLSEMRRATNQLLKLRLISSDRDRDRLLYYAANPSLAWLALVADLVWGRDVVLSPITALPATDSPRVENLRMLCTEISSAAQRLYKPHSAVLAHKVHDPTSPNEFAQLICEMIGQARHRILAVSKSPRLPQVSSF